MKCWYCDSEMKLKCCYENDENNIEAHYKCSCGAECVAEFLGGKINE